MAWITPVTDRGGPSTRTTAADMNRIAGNINELLGTTLKDNYTTGITADIVTDTEWNAIVAAAQQLDHFGLNVTDSTLYSNLNAIELIALYNTMYEPLRLNFTLSKRLGGGKL